MRRRLFNAFCLLSLVLAVAVAALWVRSVWWASDALEIYVSNLRLMLASEGGAISVSVDVPLQTSTVDHTAYDPQATLRWLPKGGVGRNVFTGDRYVFVALPAWMSIGMLMPLVIVGAVRIRSSPPMTACPRCGYDLRGSSGGACPECGEATSDVHPT